MSIPEEKAKDLPRLRGVLAANASPMTGNGTTSYLLGEGLVTVIDPGPDEEDHLAALLAALAPDERIEAILITHPHLDHSALAPRLAALTGAKTYGFGPAGSARSPLMQRLAAEGLRGGEGADPDFTPDVLLQDGARLRLGCGEIEVLHTPGHMAEHLAFALGDRLFCGDLVMDWAPSLVSPPDGDMGAYFASMERLAARQWRIFYPTHGGAIETPAARIAELIAHRRLREAQVLAALQAGASDLAAITEHIYAELAPPLKAAAARNALSHLIELSQRGLVLAEGPSFDLSRYSLKRLETSARGNF